jgi:hypothetical protein
MKRNKLIIFAIALITLGSCTKKLDELLVNPNTPSVDKADPALYLTQAQLSYASFISQTSGVGRTITRQTNFGAQTYRNGFSAQSFDGIWSTAYTGVFKHVNALIPIATTNKQWVNTAMAKIMKAHTMMILVDIFGDIPSTEANLGVGNTNPKVDKGKDVYAAAIALLDDAIADLGKGTPGSYPGTNDLFYGTTSATGMARWRTAAKLLKLRAYSTIRLVDPSVKDKINTLIADADITGSVGTTANDFEFKYSTKQSNPDSRHPDYASNYQPTGSASDYIQTHFAWALAVEKGTGDNNNDPRIRYYLYRQRINYAARDENTMACSVQSKPPHYTASMPFCYTISGYWTRDMGDASGIPPDGQYRTTYGIYPAGGEFDANQGTSVSLNRGGNGAGIEPIWQSAFTEFTKAECALTIGTNGNARTLLENGIRRSMAKVAGFPAVIGAGASVPTAFAMTQARIDGYVNKVLAAYDAATTNDAKLNVIAKEYYLALWGNGMEVYNLYRRTGKPDNLQYMLNPNPGNFTRSMFYPSNYVNLNKQAVQKSDVDVQVFWDNNPPGFIK